MERKRRRKINILGGSGNGRERKCVSGKVE
jgi:hypothetical protein